MGGCRCSYKNCTNTTKTRDNLHFFHYPVKQKDRCRQWIENANKPQFYDLDEDQLRNKVICETHFKDCFFPNTQKKRLLQGAIPTLEGDCEATLSIDNSMKIQDVQVLPANADGTIFVLETNMQNNFQSEKVESYIYTNNGLMLPINKSNDNADDSIQTIFSESEPEEIGLEMRMKAETEFFSNLGNTHCESTITDKEFDTFILESTLIAEDATPMNTYEKKTPQKVTHMERKNQHVEHQSPLKMADDIFSRTEGNKYVRKIKQHSKDIAILKRLLKSKKQYRRPNNMVILNTLRKQISPSLFSVVNINLNGKYEFSAEDLEFFSTIHSTSPQVYEILSQKYKWKLPNPELFNNLTTNKNNGHVYCEDN